MEEEFLIIIAIIPTETAEKKLAMRGNPIFQFFWKIVK